MVLNNQLKFNIMKQLYLKAKRLWIKFEKFMEPYGAAASAAKSR